jgi:hypothetical protein
MEVNNQTKPVSRQVARKFAGSLKQMVISLSIIALGILLTIILIKSRRPPQQKEQEILAPLVMDSNGHSCVWNSKSECRG